MGAGEPGVAGEAVQPRVKSVVQVVADSFAVPEAVDGREHFTRGDWADEAAAAAAFDAAVERTGCFMILREIHGEYIHPKMLSGSQRCRLDRVLMPLPKLIEAGWKHGPIGVEIEASGRKVAGPINQLLDYHRAVWHLPRPRVGYHVMLEWFGVFPMGGLYCDIASVAAQNRICGINIGWQGTLQFKSSATNGLLIAADGVIVSARGFASGLKTGHRCRT